MIISGIKKEGMGGEASKQKEQYLNNPETRVIISNSTGYRDDLGRGIRANSQERDGYSKLLNRKLT